MITVVDIAKSKVSFEDLKNKLSECGAQALSSSWMPTEGRSFSLHAPEFRRIQMKLTRDEIIETIRMVQSEKLGYRTVTLGISLRDCAANTVSETADKIYTKLVTVGKNLVSARQLEMEYGIPIINKRISVTPIAMVAESCKGTDYALIAKAMDCAAKQLGIDFIGGFSALVKGLYKGRYESIKFSPRCSSVNRTSLLFRECSHKQGRN